MKKIPLIECLQRFFSGPVFDKPDGVAAEPLYFGKRDAAVLEIAMMVAALDGMVTDDELATFRKLAKKCKGCNEESSKELFREGLRSAGYVELAARTLSADEIRAIFVEEARKLLPNGFAYDDAAGVRGAFITWIAMAMSDSDYSESERKAIDALAAYVKNVIEERQESNCRRQSLSPAFAAANRETETKGFALEPAFFEKAEALISKLNDESTAADATAELEDLIRNG